MIDTPLFIFNNKFTFDNIENLDEIPAEVLTPYTHEHASISNIILDLIDSTGVEAVAILYKNRGEHSATLSTAETIEDEQIVVDRVESVTDSNLIIFDEVDLLKITSLTINAEVITIFAGSVLQFDFGIKGGFTPINKNRETTYQTNLTAGGNFVGRSIDRVAHKGAIKLENIDGEKLYNKIELFAKSAQLSPFIFSWKPVSKKSEAVYCWSDNDIVASYTGDRWQMSLELKVNAYA